MLEMVHVGCQLRVTHNFKHTSPRLDKQRMELKNNKINRALWRWNWKKKKPLTCHNREADKFAQFRQMPEVRVLQIGWGERPLRAGSVINMMQNWEKFQCSHKMQHVFATETQDYWLVSRRLFRGFSWSCTTNKVIKEELHLLTDELRLCFRTWLDNLRLPNRCWRLIWEDRGATSWSATLCQMLLHKVCPVCWLMPAAKPERRGYDIYING